MQVNLFLATQIVSSNLWPSFPSRFYSLDQLWVCSNCSAMMMMMLTDTWILRSYFKVHRSLWSWPGGEGYFPFPSDTWHFVQWPLSCFPNDVISYAQKKTKFRHHIQTNSKQFTIQTRTNNRLCLEAAFIAIQCLLNVRAICIEHPFIAWCTVIRLSR